MSTAAAIPRWMEWFGDRLNAILVKETRQSLKSRQFLAVFSMMLAVSWLIAVAGIMMFGGGGGDRQVGRGLFVWYYGVLAITIFVVVPFGAFRSLLAERDLNTFELLNITTLSPQRIVWGKMLSTMVQLFIYYSALTPFMAFTYQLGGINWPTIAYVLAMSLLASMHLSMFALMLSSFARNRVIQVLLSLSLLSGLVFSFFMSMSLVSATVAFEIPFSDEEFLIPNAILLTFAVPTFLLYLQIATSQLTFEADNRSTGIRLTCAAIFALGLFWTSVPAMLVTFIGPTGWLGITRALEAEGCVVIGIFLGLWLSGVGLFAVTEDDYLSRRVRRDLPRSQLLRLLIAPLIPGASRGLLYILLQVFVLWVGISSLILMDTRGMSNIDNSLATIAGIALYVTTYLSLGSILAKGIRSLSPDVHAAHARVLLVFLIAAGCIVPHFMELFDYHIWEALPLLYVTDPFSTCYRLMEHNKPDVSLMLLIILGAGATVSLLLNLVPVVRGVVEIVSNKMPASTRQPPAYPPGSAVAQTPAASQGAAKAKPASDSTPEAAEPVFDDVFEVNEGPAAAS